MTGAPPTSTPPPRCCSRRASTALADAAEAASCSGGGLGGDALGRLAGRGGHGVGPRRDRVPVAGPGAPLVGEFSVTEFAAAIGLPTEAGKAYLGEAVELRYRLVGLVPGQRRDLPPGGPAGRPRTMSCHGGRRVRGPPRRPSRTRSAPPSSTAGRGGDRAVHARGGRTPPPPAADGRSFTIDTGNPRWHQHRVRGARPRRRPRPRRRRRRRGAGVEGPRLHRHPGRAPGHRGRGPRPPPAHPRPQPPPRRTGGIDGTTRRRPAGRPATGADGDPTVGPGGPRRDTRIRKPRQVVLYVHLSDAAVVPGAPLEGASGGRTPGPVHAEQIRQWCGNPDAEITGPVFDLGDDGVIRLPPRCRDPSRRGVHGPTGTGARSSDRQVAAGRPRGGKPEAITARVSTGRPGDGRRER